MKTRVKEQVTLSKTIEIDRIEHDIFTVRMSIS